MRMVALAVAALLLVGSCTDDPEPIEPEPMATPRPTESPPAIPTSATKNTPAGAANFVKHWIAISNYAAQTGNTSELKELSDSSCTGCDRYVELYESIYADGGYIKGASREIGEVDLEVTNGEVVVRGDVRASKGQYRESKGGRERISKANVTLVEFAVAFENSEWHMKQIGLPK